MFHLFITTGIKRGECVGIKWNDIDFKNSTLTIARCVTHTPEAGVTAGDPHVLQCRHAEQDFEELFR